MAKNDFQKTDKKFIILGVEKRQAKFYVIDSGSIKETNIQKSSDKTNPTRGSYPSGITYPRVDKVARHADQHLNRFLKEVVDSLQKISKKYPDYFIVLAGRSEAFPKLKYLLPDNLNKKVKAKVKADLDMNDNEIFLKVRNLLEKPENTRGFTLQSNF